MIFRHSLFATSLFCTVVSSVHPLHAQTASSTPVTDVRQGSFFSYNGEQIFYQQSGNGPELLLIHGFPLSGQLFADDVANLATRFHVTIVDLPGFGRSTTTTTQQTDATYADAMLALLSSLNITKSVIGGHSMGGQITLEMYAKNPALFSGMILFDTNPAAASIIEMHEWPGYGAQAQAKGTASLGPVISPVMVTGHALRLFPDLRQKLQHIVDAATPQGVQGGANALVTRPDYKPMLSAIAVPALVIVGEDDPLYAYPVSQALQAAIPGAELLIIGGAGHASMFQRPSAADNGILEWATEHGLVQ